jgi:transposase
MAERKVYTAEFKLEAIRLVQLPERTVAQVADELGIGRSTLTAWLRRHRQQGERAFPGHGRHARGRGDSSAQARVGDHKAGA